jgi:Fe-S-cluster formation regulator IscX/YfhJ
MSKYYYLIAGLPSIALDDAKITRTVADFKEELEPLLSEPDRQLMRWFYLQYDNRNLLSFLQKKNETLFDGRGVFSKEDIQAIYDLLKDEDRAPAQLAVPAYFAAFIRDYLVRMENDESIDIHIIEDQLSASYFEAAMSCGNEFLSSWFEMNLNMRNIFIALNCRKYGLNIEQFIIGNNEIAEQLRQSSSRDFHFTDAADYIVELLQVAEEKETLMREKRLDAIRWKWLDEHTFFKTFDLESVIAFMLRLEMIERWIGLDKERGATTFRRLVSDMKRESADTLEKFKENNK